MRTRKAGSGASSITAVSDPVSDWYKLLQPGDVVRMGWAGLDFGGAGQHTTSVFQVLSDGSHTVAQVWDNNDYRNDGNVDYIGLHDATYWDATIPQTITIYRLDPKQQYLIKGTGLGEFIQGSVFNNLIEPGGGADTIAAGLGSNEIAGRVSDLNHDAVTDFHSGDWLDLSDMPFEGAVPSYDVQSGVLTITSGVQTAALSLVAGLPGMFTAGSDGASGTEVRLACYVVGTRIGVPGRANGAAIESLVIGDLVETEAGIARPVKWIGRRSYSARFVASYPQVQPIRFRAGSLGEGLPHRDLLVSPMHAMFLNGLLVPATHLVNGVSIIKEQATDTLHYFHIELSTHDVLLAEGVASESFVDDGTREMFHNADEFATLYPHDETVPAIYCAPRVEDGEELEAIRRMIDRRAALSPVRRRAA